MAKRKIKIVPKLLIILAILVSLVIGFAGGYVMGMRDTFFMWEDFVEGTTINIDFNETKLVDYTYELFLLDNETIQMMEEAERFREIEKGQALSRSIEAGPNDYIIENYTFGVAQ